MNKPMHAIEPEVLMAYVDGELAEAEAHEVACHLEGCVECQLSVMKFGELSEFLAQWQVAAAPGRLNEKMTLATVARSGHKLPRGWRTLRWNGARMRWALGGCGAIVVAAGLSIPSFQKLKMMPSAKQLAVIQKSDTSLRAREQTADLAPPPIPPNESRAARAQQLNSPSKPARIGGIVAFNDEAKQEAPMIARTVSLSLMVQDFGAARVEIDGILVRHHGYAGKMTVSTPERGARTFEGSLKIPAPELESALRDLRKVGRVQYEEQSGEEVTQQKVDLEARLTNARETEQRFRAILVQHAGKIDEILQVEQEIARVRGEIEGMEADQKALLHRVDFAEVELLLNEANQAKLSGSNETLGDRFGAAFVAGFRHVWGAVLGVALFLAEFGPVTLLVCLVLLPFGILWLRYRKMRSRL